MKCYTPADFQYARNATTAFASRGAMQIAPLLGASEPRATLVHRWMPGQRLSDGLNGGRAPSSVLRDVGAALAEVHATPFPKGLRTRHAVQLSERLAEHAETIAILSPTNGARASAIAADLMHQLHGTSSPVATIHGDCYAKQFLVSPQSITVLDFDDAAYGAPAADLGLFIAHLERDVARGAFSEADAARYSTALLEGYEANSGQRPAALTTHIASGLFSLTHHPFRHREPDWEERLTDLLDRTERWLQRARRDATTMVAV